MRLDVEGWRSDPRESRCRLEPGESRPVRFDVLSPVPAPGREYPVVMRVRTEAGRLIDVSGSLNFLGCIRRQTEIEIDGDTADWASVPRVPIGTEWPPMNPTAYHGERDCSGTFGAAWDDVFLQTHSGTAVWRQDCVQVAIDPRPADVGDFNPLVGVFGCCAFEYGLSLTPNGPEVWRWCSPVPDRRPPETVADDVRLAVTRGAGSACYEAAFPWSSLGVETPSAGQQIGLALAVNDDDGGGRKAILWFEGIVHSKDPSQYGRATLVEAE